MQTGIIKNKFRDRNIIIDLIVKEKTELETGRKHGVSKPRCNQIMNRELKDLFFYLESKGRHEKHIDFFVSLRHLRKEKEFFEKAFSDMWSSNDGGN